MHLGPHLWCTDAAEAVLRRQCSLPVSVASAAPAGSAASGREQGADTSGLFLSGRCDDGSGYRAMNPLFGLRHNESTESGVCLFKALAHLPHQVTCLLPASNPRVRVLSEDA